MKKPKEPKTWKRPRLYFQEADSEFTSRIRIIYPDGRSEWMCCHYPGDGADFPCWAEDHVNKGDDYYGKDSSPEEALRRMRKYDREYGFPEAIFCGEL